MISIIICSRNPHFYERINKTINDTINIPYEVLFYDNLRASNKIADVYNKQGKLAYYDYLVFLHDDIMFHSQNWGSYIIETLNKQNVGLLGICGGKYYPDLPCSWIDIPHYLRRASMVNQLDGKYVEYNLQDNPEDYLSETKTLDGVFLAMKKSTLQEFPFYSNNALNFHFYDIGLSLKIGRDKKLVIDHRIKLEHFSTGKWDRPWIKDAFEFYRQEHHNFPGKNISGENGNSLEDFAFKRMIERIVDCGSFYYMIKLFKVKPLLFIKNTIFLLKLLF